MKYGIGDIIQRKGFLFPVMITKIDKEADVYHLMPLGTGVHWVSPNPISWVDDETILFQKAKR